MTITFIVFTSYAYAKRHIIDAADMMSRTTGEKGGGVIAVHSTDI